MTGHQMLYNEALTLVKERFLSGYIEDFGSPAILLESETEEHEWGWVFHCRVEDPSIIPLDKINRDLLQAILIDRETGRVFFSSLAHREWGIQRLLGFRHRDK